MRFHFQYIALKNLNLVLILELKVKEKLQIEYKGVFIYPSQDFTKIL